MFTTKTKQEILEFVVVPPAPSDIHIAYTAVEAVIQNNDAKIASIKRLKNIYGIGLRDAKEIVEAVGLQMGHVFAETSNFCTICSAQMQRMYNEDRFKCVYFYCQGNQVRYDAMRGEYSG